MAPTAIMAATATDTIPTNTLETDITPARAMLSGIATGANSITRAVAMMAGVMDVAGSLVAMMATTGMTADGDAAAGTADVTRIKHLTPFLT